MFTHILPELQAHLDANCEGTKQLVCLFTCVGPIFWKCPLHSFQLSAGPPLSSKTASSHRHLVNVVVSMSVSVSPPGQVPNQPKFLDQTKTKQNQILVTKPNQTKPTQTVVWGNETKLNGFLGQPNQTKQIQT